MSIVKLTTENFEQEVLQSDRTVLVDFYADWCGPCKMIAPTIDEVAAEVEGRARVVKVDIDASPDVAGRYGVMSVPTLMVFKNGQPVRQAVGVQPKQNLLAMLA